MNHEKFIYRQRKRRSFRVRKSIRGTADKPRLCVNRTLKHVYCQLIDDAAGKTLASASTRDKDVVSSVKFGGNCDAAVVVGKTLAERAKAQGIERICFDRGRFKYHGRIAALADAVRESGIVF